MDLAATLEFPFAVVWKGMTCNRKSPLLLSRKVQAGYRGRLETGFNDRLDAHEAPGPSPDLNLHGTRPIHKSKSLHDAQACLISSLAY